MNFTQAVTSVLRNNYANFKGRASRAEFWWYYLFIIIVYVIFMALFMIAGGYEWLDAVLTSTMSGEMAIPPAPGFIKFLAFAYAVFGLAVMVPNLAVITRRFHDRNMSGWWVVGLFAAAIISSFLPFINLVIVIAIYVICALEGTKGENKYGPQPLA